MEVNRDTLDRIARETTCEWTRGFLHCLLGEEAPTRSEIARQLIELELKNNGKIHAIKRIREAFGVGLKEAKAIVDEFQITGRIILDDGDEPGPAGVTV